MQIVMQIMPYLHKWIKFGFYKHDKHGKIGKLVPGTPYTDLYFRSKIFTAVALAIFYDNAWLNSQ